MRESSTDVLMLERRRHERLRPDREVTIRCTEGVLGVFGWGDTYDIPALLDLSSHGARLATVDDPEVGSILCLDVQTDLGENFEIVGEVRWSRPGASAGGRFQCGVEFFNFIPRQRREIHDLCRRVHDGFEGIPSSSRSSIPV